MCAAIYALKCVRRFVILITDTLCNKRYEWACGSVLLGTWLVVWTSFLYVGVSATDKAALLLLFAQAVVLLHVSFGLRVLPVIANTPATGPSHTNTHTHSCNAYSFMFLPCQ